MSWVAPASRGDLLFLEPSIRYCSQRLEWTPDIVVGDLSYLSLPTQRRLREQMPVAVVTKFRSDMVLPDEFDSPSVMTCPQGQILRWLGLHEEEQLHWFGVVDENPLCTWCWQSSSCPRQFSFQPADHEILYGTIPVSSRVAQQLLRQARSWIEATQSYDKNQLGLGQMFLNSLRLTWIMSLLADTVSLLRAHAFLNEPKDALLLGQLSANQMSFNFQ